jgi:hypothetical protein
MKFVERHTEACMWPLQPNPIHALENLSCVSHEECEWPWLCFIRTVCKAVGGSLQYTSHFYPVQDSIDLGCHKKGVTILAVMMQGGQSVAAEQLQYTFECIRCRFMANSCSFQLCVRMCVTGDLFWQHAQWRTFPSMSINLLVPLYRILLSQSVSLCDRNRNMDFSRVQQVHVCARMGAKRRAIHT